MEESQLVLPSQNKLLDKNNSIITGYENFCIKKGTKKFFPSKDFDFIGKQIACQKCYKKFASQFSYKAHINTSICVKTCNGPNLIYLKYKNRNGKRNRIKPKINSVEDIHDTKKYLLNPEMLNTLQTRNKCYSDIVHQRNEVIKRNKEKQANYYTINDESLVAKLRGRPRKHIVPKRRGRPKKSNPGTVDSESQRDHSLNTKSNVTELKEPKMVIVRKADDNYKHNVDKDFSSEMKILTDRFLEIYNTVWAQVEVTDGFQNSSKNNNQSGYNKEEEKIHSAFKEKEKEICLNIKVLDNDLNFLYKQFKDRNEHTYSDQLKFMLSKLHEKYKNYNQNKLKKTETNTGTTYKRKENIQLTRKKNKEDVDKNIKTYVETCLGNDNGDAVSPSVSIISNDDCESYNCVEIITLGKESTSLDNDEENMKTYKEDDYELYEFN